MNKWRSVSATCTKKWRHRCIFIMASSPLLRFLVASVARVFSGGWPSSVNVTNLFRFVDELVRHLHVPSLVPSASKFGFFIKLEFVVAYLTGLKILLLSHSARFSWEHCFSPRLRELALLPPCLYRVLHSERLMAASGLVCDAVWNIGRRRFGETYFFQPWRWMMFPERWLLPLTPSFFVFWHLQCDISLLECRPRFTNTLRRWTISELERVNCGLWFCGSWRHVASQVEERW